VFEKLVTDSALLDARSVVFDVLLCRLTVLVGNVLDSRVARRPSINELARQRLGG
jgi:hypothetical protein